MASFEVNPTFQELIQNVYELVRETPPAVDKQALEDAPIINPAAYTNDKNLTFLGAIDQASTLYYQIQKQDEWLDLVQLIEPLSNDAIQIYRDTPNSLIASDIDIGSPEYQVKNFSFNLVPNSTVISDLDFPKGDENELKALKTQLRAGTVSKNQYFLVSKNNPMYFFILGLVFDRKRKLFRAHLTASEEKDSKIAAFGHTFYERLQVPDCLLVFLSTEDLTSTDWSATALNLVLWTNAKPKDDLKPENFVSPVFRNSKCILKGQKLRLYYNLILREYMRVTRVDLDAKPLAKEIDFIVQAIRENLRKTYAPERDFRSTFTNLYI